MKLSNFTRPALGPSQPPNSRIRLNRQHYFARNLVFSAYNSAEDWRFPIYDYVTKKFGTGANVGGYLNKKFVYSPNNSAQDALYGAAKGLGHGYNAQIAGAPLFNGTTSWANFPVDLSPYSSLTIAFWLNIQVVSGGVVFEYPANSNTQSGLWATPDEGSGAHHFGMGHSRGDGSTFAWVEIGTTPALDTWHHFMLGTIRQSGNGMAFWYGDGALFGATTHFLNVGTGSYGATGGFNIGARNSGASLFANVAVCGVNVWSKLFNAEELNLFYTNTWQHFQVDDARGQFVPAVAPPPAGKFRWFLGAD